MISFPSLRCAFAALVLSGLPAQAMVPSCQPDALGTSREIHIGPNAGQGLAVGLKTYPRTLALADHELVLTFDDGPWPATTPKVLEALARECVKATFFLIGRNAEAAPALVRREIVEGHSVGHHTFSHPSLTLRGLRDEAARADIEHGFGVDDQAAYGTYHGEPRTPFFRFPGFGDTQHLLSWLAQRNIAVFGADLWASDWVTMTPEAELNLLLGRIEAQGRGIILLHDTKDPTAAMLPALLRTLKQRGYKIVHLVADPASPGPVSTLEAPAGWSSETARTLQKMWPKAPPARKKPIQAPASFAEPEPLQLHM